MIQLSYTMRNRESRKCDSTVMMSIVMVGVRIMCISGFLRRISTPSPKLGWATMHIRDTGAKGKFFGTKDSFNADSDPIEPDDESIRLKRQAEELRKQIRELEIQLGDRRVLDEDGSQNSQWEVSQTSGIKTEVKKSVVNKMSLRGKRVLVVGANGRVGSMVCRYLLRNFAQTQVVAAVHYARCVF